MKKFLILFLFLPLLSGCTTDNITEQKNDSKQIELTTNTITTVYTIKTANVRSCPSLNCEIVGTYPVNTDFVLPSPINDMSQLPDWYSFKYPAPEYNLVGYISKSVLSDTPVSINQDNQNNLAETQSYKPGDTTQPSGTLCNGTYYSACPSGEIFICPPSGNAYCQTQSQQTATVKNNNAVNPNNQAPINIYGNASSYQRVGNTTIGSDGSMYQQVGNTVISSDGRSYQRVGNTIIGSDGTSYQQVGNTVIRSDGTSYQQVGNTTIGSDGSNIQQVGNTTFIQP